MSLYRVVIESSYYHDVYADSLEEAVQLGKTRWDYETWDDMPIEQIEVYLVR
jgi:hypothetical protein